MTLHDAVLILNYLNERGIEFAKFPSGKIVTRMDCIDIIEGN